MYTIYRTIGEGYPEAVCNTKTQGGALTILKLHINSNTNELDEVIGVFQYYIGIPRDDNDVITYDR